MIELITDVEEKKNMKVNKLYSYSQVTTHTKCFMLKSLQTQDELTMNTKGE